MSSAKGGHCYQKYGGSSAACRTASCSQEPSFELGRRFLGLKTTCSSSFEPSVELARHPPPAVAPDPRAAVFGKGDVKLVPRRPRTPLCIGKDHDHLFEAQSSGPRMSDEQRIHDLLLPCSSPWMPRGQPAETKLWSEPAWKSVSGSAAGSRPFRRKCVSNLREVTGLISTLVDPSCCERSEPSGGRAKVPRSTQLSHDEQKNLTRSAANARPLPSEGLLQGGGIPQAAHAQKRAMEMAFRKSRKLLASQGSTAGKTDATPRKNIARSRYGPRVSRKIACKVAVMMSNLRKEANNLQQRYSVNTYDQVIEDQEAWRNDAVGFKRTEGNHEREGQLETGERADVAGTFATSNLWKYAVRFKIPLDILVQAADLFSEFCELHAKKNRHLKAKPEEISKDIFEDGFVTTDKFGSILCKLVGVADQRELPDGLLRTTFEVADANRSKTVDFAEFTQWYSRFSFSEDMLLTPEQKELRRIARTFGMTIMDVEHYKRCFDEYDSDKSGQIDEDEFQALLCRLLKIPQHLELPKTRVRQFWLETDIDGSGSIAFEEFLVFYKKYFENTGNSQGRGNGCPLEEFYRGVRTSSIRPSGQD